MTSKVTFLIDWTAFVRDDCPKLYRYFCARFPPTESSDLVQEVLLRIYRKQGTDGYDPSQGPLVAYALGVAHFVAREFQRKTNRTRENLLSYDSQWIDVPSLKESPEELAIEEQAARRLRAAICQLPAAEQEILALVIERELSLQDIAIILEKPIGTVKSHIHRAKSKLKETLLRNRPEVTEREVYAKKEIYNG